MTHPKLVSTRLGRAAALGLALAFVSGGAPLRAQDGVQLFTEPPAPRQLADILFPPRYRTIVLGSAQRQEPEQPKAFGLLVNFEFNSTTIVPASLPLLDSVGEALNTARAAGQAIVIEGHTDASGAEKYNQRLSELRARAIKRYLTSIYRIEPTRLVIEGKGERELYNRIDPKDPINRRVQFRALGRG